MKLIVLGSGGSEGIPVPYCDCKVCKSGKHRLRTSYLIKIKDKNLLVESSPDFRQQQLKHNFSVDYLFISHDHSDHINGLQELRHIMLIAKIKIKPINILISKKLHKRLLHQPCIERQGIRYAYNSLIRNKKLIPHLLDYWKRYKFDGFEIELFKNRHENITCDGFLLESKGKSIVYLADAGVLYHKTEDLINNNPDLLITHTPYFYSAKKLKKDDHNNARKMRLTHHIGIDNLHQLKAKKILLSHFSHRAGLTHKEIKKEIAKHKNIRAAYDGMELKI